MSTATPTNSGPELQIRDDLAKDYADIYTPEALAALRLHGTVQRRAETPDG